MEGVPVSSRQTLGARMSLVISVLTRDITLDLHVSQCEGRSEDGSAVVLVQDGCSASRVMGEFREVLGVVHDETFGEHTVRKVTQFATMMAFNTKIEPQTMTVICNVKLCGGECAERPACVSSDINLGRGKRPPVPLFEKAVTLGKVFQVGGLPDEPSQEMLAMILTAEEGQPSQPRDGKSTFLFDDCVPPRTFYIILSFLSAMYLMVLLACIYCVRRTTSKTVTKKFVDDYESPPRSLYQERGEAVGATTHGSARQGEALVLRLLRWSDVLSVRATNSSTGVFAAKLSSLFYVLLVSFCRLSRPFKRTLSKAVIPLLCPLVLPASHFSSHFLFTFPSLSFPYPSLALPLLFPSFIPCSPFLFPSHFFSFYSLCACCAAIPCPSPCLLSFSLPFSFLLLLFPASPSIPCAPSPVLLPALLFSSLLISSPSIPCSPFLFPSPSLSFYPLLSFSLPIFSLFCLSHFFLPLFPISRTCSNLVPSSLPLHSVSFCLPFAFTPSLLLSLPLSYLAFPSFPCPLPPFPIPSPFPLSHTLLFTHSLPLRGKNERETGRHPPRGPPTHP
ncbi:hypothetical protein C7M84_017954 [Penaeus vannamei]|uniref:ZP domain-containing protein n=1 Tax=Penaeus vannamei TaxID=6689 RepID=A0A423SJ12_PENVA|nr:hypothetical protein C7M84_017954 [Penaeus vannamei]